MRDAFENRINLILVSAILVVCIAIGVPLCFSQCEVKTDANDASAATEETTTVETTATTAATTADKPSDEVEIISQDIKLPNKKAQSSPSVEKSEKKSEAERIKAKKLKAEKERQEKLKAKKAKKADEQKPTEEVQFATAKPVEHPASYEAQWNAGYLLAIDNPDKGYKCPHIELSDDDRDLLERLCYGEFGTGGFTGAALIAQSVKCAMVDLGTSDVSRVIRDFRYTGSTHSGTSEACKKAVIYIFDMDKDAVQHRLLYMYNPTMVSSAFHESQNYICSFKEIRFFDRK